MEVDTSQGTQLMELSKRNDQTHKKLQNIANKAVAAMKREYIAMPPGYHEKSGRVRNKCRYYLPNKIHT